MKRWLFKLVVFLLLGAVVNVAVAWGCGVFAVRVPGGAGIINIEDVWDIVHPTRQDLQWLSRSGWQPRPDELEFTWKAASREITGLGLSRKGFFDYPMVKSGRNGRPYIAPLFAIRDRTGWPFRCLQAEKWVVDTFTNQYSTRYAVTSVSVSYQWNSWMITDTRPLPYRPIWPGFAINTVFYAALLWIVILGPGTTRRMIRRKRGHCIKCGYDLRGDFSSGCPECGWRRPQPPLR